MSTINACVEGWLSEKPPSKDQHEGLFLPDGKPVPLKSREVQATCWISKGLSFTEVEETFTYLAASEPVTVRFVFPLPPKSAVHRFRAVLGEREVVTEVKKKEEAQEEFDDAVLQGHTAVMMKQEPGASLFSVDLGNLQAMEEATVTFSYVRLMETVPGAVEFSHQATWVPPYLGPSDEAAPGGLPAVVAATPKFVVGKPGYTLSYRVRLLSAGGFGGPVEANADGVVVQDVGPEERVATLTTEVADPSRDLSLLVLLPAAGKAEEGGTGDQPNSQGALLRQECKPRAPGGRKKTVLLASFNASVPKAPAEAAPQKQPECELWLVIDGSGSMCGDPIEAAKEAATFFVKDLPMNANVFFNICMFGSSHKLMWKEARLYDASTQEEALKWISHHVNADYGGTEIHSCLEAVYGAPLPAKGRSRQIIFMTDGGVSGYEEDNVMKLVAEHAPRLSSGAKGTDTAKPTEGGVSVFCMGIGHGVHRGLVEGIAKKSGGVSQFVTDEGITRKAGFLKRCALAASTRGCWVRPRLVARSCMARVAPHVLPPRLFPDEPLQLLVEVSRCEPGACLELAATLPDGTPVAASLPLDAAQQQPGRAFAVLHAMAGIGALMSGESHLHMDMEGSPLAKRPDSAQVKEAVVALALEEGLVTPYTAAVGVAVQHNPVDPADVQKVEVPLQVPHGRTLWQQQQQQDREMCSGFPGGPMLRGGDPIILDSCWRYCTIDPCSAAPPPPPSSSGLGALATKAGGFMGGLFKGIKKAVAQKTSKSSQPAPMACAAALCSSGPYPGMAAGSCAAPMEAMDCMVGSVAACRMSAAAPMDMADEDQADEWACAEACAEAPATVAVRGDPRSVLRLLNERRDAAGVWADDAAGALLTALLSQRADAGPELLAPTRAAKPEGVSDNQWATVLAIAFLRKHMSSEREAWQVMEDKAMEELQKAWPAGARSIASCLMAAMKLL